MATVDNKVVSLEFNNSRFNSNVQSTMSALDKLKEKLSFKGGTKGFEDIQRSADQVKIDNISRGIEGVSKGFLAMSTVAATALSRITDSAITAGSRIAKALTIAPVLDGFGEYETKMGSIQTILSNTKADGTTLDQVTDSLQKLNTYADQTIYNFGEMARNIGTFTAAGIDLDTSVSSIKGIANIAAISGSSSEQASTAMYQLSQALASGSLKLMDWNSVVNAGMGGEVMQKSLFESGKALGTLKDVPIGETFDEWKAKGNTFRESLQDEWITSDVLTTTLSAAAGELNAIELQAKGFTKAQAEEMVALGETGVAAATQVKTATQLVGTIAEAMGSSWATSFELIIGNFDEAKTLFTNISNYVGGIIGKSADARNQMLLDWKNFGGRDALLQGFLYAWEDILSVLKPVGEAFRSVFPKKTAADLLIMTDKFRDLFKNFKIGEGVTKAIKGVFTVFFSVIKAGFSVISFLGKALFNVIGAIGSFIGAVAKAGGGAIKAFFGAITDLFKTLTGGAGEAASGALEGISSGARTLGTWLGNLLGNLAGVTERIREFTKNLKLGDKATGASEKSTSRFAGVIEWFKNVFSGIGNFFGALFDGVSNFGELIGNVASSIVDAMGNIGGGMSSAFSDINWNAVIGGVGVGAGVMLVKRIREFLDGVDIGEMLQGIADSFKNVLDSAAEALDAFTLQVKAEAIMKIAIAIGLLVAALVVLASIDPQKLAIAGAAMAGMFLALNRSISSLMGLQLPTGAQMFGLAAALIGIAGAILILSFAMKQIQDLDNGDISAGLVVVSAMITGLTVSAKQMAKDTGTMAKAGLSMMGMAVSIYILTFALERMAKIDPVKAIAGAVAVAVAMAAMAIALKQVDEKQAASKGLAFTLVALGLNIFAKAVETFGTMKIATLAQGFGVIAAILTGLVFFFKALPDNMILVAGQILIISVALNVLSYAIEAMGSMDWDVMKQGLIGIAGALAIMAIAANVMNSAIVGAGAIVVMAVGLTLLAGAVSTFGQMGVDTMIKSILGIAAVLVVIGAAGALMGLIAPLLLAGGVAFTVLGLGMLLFGAGAWLAATAILALAGASAVGVKKGIAAIQEILKALPSFMAALALGVIEGIKTILDAIPGLAGSITEAVTSLLGMLVDIITTFIDENLDDIVQAGFDILLALMRGIRDNLGEITETAVEIIIEFVNGLATAIDEKSEELAEAGRNLAKALIAGLVNVLVPKEVQEAIGNIVTGMIDWFKELLGINSPSTVFLEFGGNIMEGLVNGLVAGAMAVGTFFLELPGKIIDALGDLLSFLVPKGLELLGGLLTGIWEALPGIVTFFWELPGNILSFIGDVLSTLLSKGRDLLVGLLLGLAEKLPEVGTWLSELPGKVIEFIGDVASTLLQKGRDLLQGLKDGAVEKVDALKTWLGNLPGSLAGALGDMGEKLRQRGSDFIQGFKNGINDSWEGIKSWLGDKAQSLLDTFLAPFDFGSPSKVMIKHGGWLVEGFQNGIGRQWNTLESETKKNTSSLLDLLESVVKTPNDLAFLDNLTPTITPVLDLSMVEEKARTLGDLLGIDSLKTDMAYVNAQQIATTSDRDTPTEDVGGGETSLSFVQNNYSPKALSTGDIYRGQKSQIALARKELGLVSG